jgi:hypothetical protein
VDAKASEVPRRIRVPSHTVPVNRPPIAMNRGGSIDEIRSARAFDRKGETQPENQKPIEARRARESESESRSRD